MMCFKFNSTWIFETVACFFFYFSMGLKNVWKWLESKEVGQGMDSRDLRCMLRHGTVLVDGSLWLVIARVLGARRRGGGSYLGRYKFSLKAKLLLLLTRRPRRRRRPQLTTAK